MVFHILNLNASYKSWDLGCCLGNKAQRYFDDDIVLDNLKIAISPFIVGLTGFNSSTMSSLASLTG